MKIRNILLVLTAALGAALTACDNDLAVPPVPEPDGGHIGIGTWDNPVTSAQVLSGFTNDSIATPWSTGYIVGYVNTGVSNTMSEASAALTADGCTVKSNMLISSKDPSDPEVTLTWEDCATVQLPSGPSRNALNLQDHPENYGKQVTVRGVLGSKYCGVYGVRSVDAFAWGDKGEKLDINVEPVPYLWGGWDHGTDFNAYRSEGWKILTVSGSTLGWGIASEENNSYIVASAYNAPAGDGPYIDWLVTPPVDLERSNTRTASFRMRSGYGSDDSSMQVWLFRNDVPVRQLDAVIPAAPSDGYSDWAVTNLDLSDVENLEGPDGPECVIRLGWRYETPAGGSACRAYCLDDINIGEAPELVYFGLDASASSIDWTFDNIELGGMSHIWEWYQRNGAYYLYGTAYQNGSHEALAYAVSPVIGLTDRTGLTLTFEHAANYQRNIKQLCGLMVREEGETEWTQIEIPNWPKSGTWDFASSGDIDLSDYEGKRVQFAFKYASTSSNADSWEIRNFQITGKSK